MCFLSLRRLSSISEGEIRNRTLRGVVIVWLFGCLFFGLLEATYFLFVPLMFCTRDYCKGFVSTPDSAAAGVSHRNTNCIKLQTFCIWSSLNNKKAGKLPSTRPFEKQFSTLASTLGGPAESSGEEPMQSWMFCCCFSMGCCSPSDSSCL